MQVRTWTCSNCQKVNPGQDLVCEGCGRERKQERQEAQDRSENAFDYCGWKTRDEKKQEHKCLLLATSWTSPYGTRDSQGQTVKQGYCHWHVMCLESPALAEAFDEFDEWRQDLLRRHVCTQFSHHPAQYVWRAMQGIEILDITQRLLVEPCGAHDCWAPETLRRHYARLDRDKQREEEAAQRIVPAAEAAAKLRDIEKALTAQMTLPAE